MNLIQETHITTEILLRGAVIFALLDIIFLALLTWRIKPAVFRASQSEVIAGTAVLFFGIWLGVITFFWESVYSYLFPAWSRWVLPFFQAGLSAAAALLAWQVTRWKGLHPVLAYCLCGGVWGAITHVWAVNRGVVTKPPLLQGAHPAAAVFIAFFEFIFYWCLVSAGATILHTIKRPAGPPENRAPKIIQV